MHKKVTSLGFSLFELLIVLTVVTILTLITLPHYRTLVQRHYHRQAQTALLALRVSLQAYYNEHETYQGMRVHDVPYYHIQLILNHNDGYRLTATPQNAQQQDPCGQLSVDDHGLYWAHDPNCWD